MPMTYAIADLHGRHDLLIAAFDAVEAHAGPEPATIVTLGDYVDRGPSSAEVVATLMRGARRAGDRLICLKGNHDLMMWSALTGRAAPDHWLDNGGRDTLASYGDDGQAGFRPEVVPEDHVAWIGALPLMHVDDGHVFVHAGIDPAVSLDQQTVPTLLCKRYHDRDEGSGPLHVVHGHDKQEHGPLRLDGRTNLDTHAWRTGRLVIGVFEARRPHAVGLIEVRGAPMNDAEGHHA
ncbi:metallophosphoesterase family protein [Phreatobacter stygius]|nr:metallophosphoesterase family protein [Phreatobacter stygius]